MLAIKKSKEPEFISSWIDNKKKNSKQLREFMLENEQQHVCCYCEKSVTSGNESYHIDHIRPQDKFPQLKNSYKNLVVSCQTKGRCGIARGSQFSKHFIVPTEENPEEYLTYSLNGEILPIGKNKKASETIGLLNLNASSLVKARRVLFKNLDSMRRSIPTEEFENFFEDFPTCIHFFKEQY